MTSQTISPEALGGAAAAEKQYKFFDPPHPEIPDQVFGLNSDAVLRLGRVAADIEFLPADLRIGLYKLPDAVRLLPLVEQMQSDTIEADDVRPYRRPIKNLSTKLYDIDGLTLAASALGVGIPARRALNRRIEEEFARKSIEQIEKASSSLENNAEIAASVELLSSFENPKEQFETEVNLLANEVTASIISHHSSRMNNPSYIERVDHGKGFVGFVRKAVSKIKSFFSRIFHRDKPSIDSSINAYDAANGITSVVDKVRNGSADIKNRIPMLSQLVFDKIPKGLTLPIDKLAFVAPEILNMIYSLNHDAQSQQIMNSVSSHPHELRFVTRFKRNFGRYSLDRLQNISNNLLPAVRDVIPNTGHQVNEVYDNIRRMINPDSYKTINVTEKVKTPRLSRAKDFVKSKFRRPKLLDEEAVLEDGKRQKRLLRRQK